MCHRLTDHSRHIVRTGAYLSNSPAVPWFVSTKNAHFRPLILHGPGPVPMGAKEAGVLPSGISGGLPRSLPLLRSAYGARLDPAEMCQNPIYALDELFRFYSASETQYLDMIVSVLETSIAEDCRTNPEHLSNTRTILLHSRRMLQRRQSHIAEMLNFLGLPAVAAHPADASHHRAPKQPFALSGLGICTS